MQELPAVDTGGLRYREGAQGVCYIAVSRSLSETRVNLEIRMTVVKELHTWMLALPGLHSENHVSCLEGRVRAWPSNADRSDGQCGLAALGAGSGV